MGSRAAFKILKPGLHEGNAQRLGQLELLGRNTVQTPDLLALSSRGSVPHLTSDVLQSETSIRAIHAGFEDFAENVPEPPQHFSFPCSDSESPLRRFISLPKDPLLVLGPRRGKPIPSNGPNTYTSLNISTSVGYRQLEIQYFLESIKNSRPDAVIAPVDIEFGRQAPGLKRKDKIVERSTAWLRSFETAIKQCRESGPAAPAAWVPMLPIDKEVQRTYLQHLEEFGQSFIDGIVLYDASNVLHVPKQFQELPLISLVDPKTPHDVLNLVAQGIDLIAVPFVNAASEAGVTLDLEFPVKRHNADRPLGIDLWSETFSTDLGPLSEGCSCYCCQNHHRAYIRHLLSVKEMLAWVLLQIHNHHVMDQFFAGIRSSIKDGTFEEAMSDFKLVFEPDFPSFQGQGPRLRGYQASLGATPRKLNAAPFKRMAQHSLKQPSSSEAVVNDRKEKALESQESDLISPVTEAVDLENIGFAELYAEGDRGEPSRSQIVDRQ